MQNSALVCIHEGHWEHAAQMMTKARTLASDVYAIVFSRADIDVAKRYGSTKVFYADISDPLSVRYASAIIEIIKKCSFDVVLYPSTPLFKSVSSRVAARLGCGLTADCIDLYNGDDNVLYQVAPAFSGNAKATISIPRSRPQMISILEGASRASECPVDSEIIDLEINEKPLFDIISSVDSKLRKINDSIILSAGYGIGSKSGFEKMCCLASKLGAGIGTTLSAVDAGFAPRDFLIGQTGMVVSPKIYVAFGISGQLQHLIGMKNSQCIISINNDPSAPLNAYADYFLEGDCIFVIDQMLEYFDEKR